MYLHYFVTMITKFIGEAKLFRAQPVLCSALENSEKQIIN